MYLWRNLPEGQLTAVLRWLGHRRDDRRLTAQNATKPAEAQPLAAEELPPAR